MIFFSEEAGLEGVNHARTSTGRYKDGGKGQGRQRLNAFPHFFSVSHCTRSAFSFALLSSSPLPIITPAVINMQCPAHRDCEYLRGPVLRFTDLPSRYDRRSFLQRQHHLVCARYVRYFTASISPVRKRRTIIATSEHRPRSRLSLLRGAADFLCEATRADATRFCHSFIRRRSVVKMYHTSPKIIPKVPGKLAMVTSRTQVRSRSAGCTYCRVRRCTIRIRAPASRMRCLCGCVLLARTWSMTQIRHCAVRQRPFLIITTPERARARLPIVLRVTCSCSPCYPKSSSIKQCVVDITSLLSHFRRRSDGARILRRV